MVKTSRKKKNPSKSIAASETSPYALVPDVVYAKQLCDAGRKEKQSWISVNTN